MRFSEVSGTFACNELKWIHVPIFGQYFTFPTLKLQKSESFLKLLDVKKCNIIMLMVDADVQDIFLENYHDL